MSYLPVNDPTFMTGSTEDERWCESNQLIKIGHIDGDGIGLLQGTESINVRFERQ